MQNFVKYIIVVRDICNIKENSLYIAIQLTQRYHSVIHVAFDVYSLFHYITNKDDILVSSLLYSSLVSLHRGSLPAQDCLELHFCSFAQELSRVESLYNLR